MVFFGANYIFMIDYMISSVICNNSYKNESIRTIKL